MNSFDIDAMEAALPVDAPTAQCAGLELLGQLQLFFQAHPSVDAVGFEDKVLLQVPELVGLVLTQNEWVDSLGGDSVLNDPFADLQVSLNTKLGELSHSDRNWCLANVFYPDPAGEHTFMVAATTLEPRFRQVMGDEAWSRFRAGEQQEHLEDVLPSASAAARPRM